MLKNSLTKTVYIYSSQYAIRFVSTDQPFYDHVISYISLDLESCKELIFIPMGSNNKVMEDFLRECKQQDKGRFLLHL